jgi:hypothetical protein
MVAEDNSSVPTAYSFSLTKCIALETGDEDVTSVLHPTKSTSYKPEKILITAHAPDRGKM